MHACLKYKVNSQSSFFLIKFALSLINCEVDFLFIPRKNSDFPLEKTEIPVKIFLSRKVTF